MIKKHAPRPPDPFEVGWCNWWFSVPSVWKFFHVAGNYSKGVLVLGDQEKPRLELSWVWVTRRGLDSESYVRKFLLKLVNAGKNRPQSPEVRICSLPGFEVVASIHHDGKIFSVGYCQVSHRMLQWVYHEGSKTEVKQMTACLLLWRDQPLETQSRWKFFELDFSIPAGFRLHSATLNLGDMDLVFYDPSVWGTRHRLFLRFAYPASLALSRQPMEKWLKQLLERRKGAYRLKRKIVSCEFSINSALWPGLMQKAKLHFILRTVLRPFAFRIPDYSEVSLHHWNEGDRLIWMQIAAPVQRIESTRESILRSLI